MGQCYSISGKLKYKDAEQFRTAMATSINEIECNWHKTKEEIENCKIEELLYMVFFSDSFEYKTYLNGNNEIIFHSEFDQAYCWESLMLDFFESLESVLCNGSVLYIYPDSDYDRVIISNGKFKQTH